MAETTTLGKDVFLALAAVGWADGKLDQDEADAIVKTALEEGLELGAIGEIENATRSKIELGDIDVSKIETAERLFVYAVAAWMTTLDGERDEAETKMLEEIAEKLSLSEQQCADADILVRQVAYESGDDKPFTYDLQLLKQSFVGRPTEVG